MMARSFNCVSVLSLSLRFCVYGVGFGFDVSEGRVFEMDALEVLDGGSDLTGTLGCYL